MVFYGQAVMSLHGVLWASICGLAWCSMGKQLWACTVVLFMRKLYCEGFVFMGMTLIECLLELREWLMLYVLSFS